MCKEYEPTWQSWLCQMHHVLEVMTTPSNIEHVDLSYQAPLISPPLYGDSDRNQFSASFVKFKKHLMNPLWFLARQISAALFLSFFCLLLNSCSCICRNFEHLNESSPRLLRSAFLRFHEVSATQKLQTNRTILLSLISWINSVWFE